MNIVAKLISTCHEYIKNVTHFNLLKFIPGMQHCSHGQRKKGGREGKKEEWKKREGERKERRNGGRGKVKQFTTLEEKKKKDLDRCQKKHLKKFIIE